MDERNNYSNDIYSSSQLKNDQYNDGYAAQNTAEINTAPVDPKPETAVIYKAPQPQTAGTRPAYSYEHYSAQYSAPNSRQPASPAKKKGSGRKAALIACSLALAVCLGFGGGIAGAYIMGGNNSGNTTVITTAEGNTVKAKTSNGTDTGLTVVEAAENGKQLNSVEEVVAKVKDSVVEITTESTSYSSFYGQYVTQGAGSGVIISTDGYIITNNHVIEDATNITVKTTDGKSYEGKVIGADETFDIALVKIEANGLTVATLGDSSKLNVGETSIVIGNPLGNLGGSVTKGIVSALNRNIKIDGKVMELLQTDAAINPGNSGGGMFDSNGNLVGIVVAKSLMTSDGTDVESIGYAIPINNVKSILGDLKENGRVTGRAALGVTLTDVSSESAMQRYNVDKKGVYISSLVSGGAAEKAGFMVGDRITSIDNTQVSSSSEIKVILLKHKAGDSITVTFDRDGEEKKITLELGEEADNSSDNSKKKNSNNFNPGSYDNNGGNGGNNGYDIDDWYRYFME